MHREKIRGLYGRILAGNLPTLLAVGLIFFPVFSSELLNFYICYYSLSLLHFSFSTFCWIDNLLTPAPVQKLKIASWNRESTEDFQGSKNTLTIP